MNDDSLSDVQKHESHITYNNAEFPVPTFHCVICGQSSVGFSICLKCNPQTYRIGGIEKAMAPSVFEIEIWNKAIEAAAEKVCTICLAANNIRKLKK